MRSHPRYLMAMYAMAAMASVAGVRPEPEEVDADERLRAKDRHAQDNTDAATYRASLTREERAPREPTAADIERQRVAQERQARKAARQAKGFDHSKAEASQS